MSSRTRAETLEDTSREGWRVVEIQRRRLLLAFAEVAADSGLEDAGIGRVCKHAGVSRRTFYELFGDREICFLAVFDSTIERISQSVLADYTREARWRERMRRALAALLEFFDEEPALARVFLVETLKAGPAIRERRRQVLDVLVGAVDEGRSEAKAAVGPPPLTAQSTVGGAISVIQARVLEDSPGPLIELLNPLISMVVHPYLGSLVARRELDRRISQPEPAGNGHVSELARDPFKDLPIRMTLRTARVLATIATRPGASNRKIGEAAGAPDQGQISKLLRRLADSGLIENHGQGHAKGEPNAWQLTERGRAVHRVIELP